MEPLKEINCLNQFEQRASSFIVTAIVEGTLPACDIIDLLHFHIKKIEICQKLDKENL